MLNTVATLFTGYLVNYPFASSQGKMGGTEMITESFRLSRLVRLSTLNTSIFFMGFIAIVIYYLMENPLVMIQRWLDKIAYLEDTDELKIRSKW